MRRSVVRLALGVTLAVASVAAAKPTGLVLKLTGAGKGPKQQTLGGAVVVDAGTGDVVAARSASSTRLQVEPPGGVYHVLVGIVRPKGGRGAIGELLRFTPGTTSRLRLPLTATDDPAPAVRPRGVAAGTSPVVTVGTLLLNDTDALPTAPLLSALYGVALDRCSVRWVESGATFLAARAAEIALQEQGRLDPSTPIIGDLVPAGFRVDGDVATAPGTVSGELRLVENAGNRLVGTVTFSAKPKRFVAAFSEAVAALVELICTQTTPVTETARVQVEVIGLPTTGWVIEEAEPPPGEAARIACPPDCSHAPGTSMLDVGTLQVRADPDARTGDAGPPWVVTSMDGCTGTSSLPSVQPTCDVPTSGDVTITVTVAYRPLLAFRFSGTTGQSGNGFVQSNPLPPFTDSANHEVTCYALSPDASDCAGHITAGQLIRVRTTSGDPEQRTLVSWDGPCAGQGIGPGENVCEFTITSDTCIDLTFAKPAGVPGAPRDITYASCIGGPGD